MNVDLTKMKVLTYISYKEYSKEHTKIADQLLLTAVKSSYLKKIK